MANDTLEEAAKQARKSFLIVWISIMISSAIAIGLEGKKIEQLCLPDSTNRNFDSAEKQNDEIIE